MDTHDLEIRRRPPLVASAGLVLLVVSGAVFVACGSTGPQTPQEALVESGERLAAIVEREVSDPERADVALQLLADFRSDELAFLESAAEIRGRIEAINGAYDASRDQIDAEAAQLSELRLEFGEEIVAVYAGLKQTLEPDEWDAVIAAMRAEEKRWKTLLD